VTGYPRIGSAAGDRAGSRSRAIPITVRDSDTFFRPDPGPRRTVLRAGASASAALETVTAYSGGKYLDEFRSIRVGAPNDGVTRAVRCRLPATGSHRRDLVEVTALVAGDDGPPDR
jgi:hypothetical protein